MRDARLRPLVQSSKTIMISERPSIYLEPEELRRIAKNKFNKAMATPPGRKREQMVATACAYLSLADLERWASSRALQPPR